MVESFQFVNDAFLFDALTCSRREDGLSCRHSVKPPLTHATRDSLQLSLRKKSFSLSPAYGESVGTTSKFMLIQPFIDRSSYQY